MADLFWRHSEMSRGQWKPDAKETLALHVTHLGTTHTAGPTRARRLSEMDGNGFAGRFADATQLAHRLAHEQRFAGLLRSLENCFGGDPSDGGSNPSPSVVIA